MSLMEIYGKV